MSEDEEFDKAVGQYRLKINGLMQPLRKYGQKEYVDQAIDELVHLAIALHYRLSGVDVPIEYRDIHW